MSELEERVAKILDSNNYECVGHGVTARQIIAMVKADGWIAVSERLPEEYAEDVIWCKDGYVSFGHYCGEDGLHDGTDRRGHSFIDKRERPDDRGDYDYPVGITHWMPLPNPPNYNPR